MPETNPVSYRDEYRKECLEWLEDKENRSWRLGECVNETQELLGIRPLSREDRIRITTNMKCIAPWHWVNGALKCFTHAAGGWREIKRAFLYKWWAHRIVYRGRDSWKPNFHGIKRAFCSADELTNLAAMGLSIARPEAIWLLDLMESGLEDGTVDWSDDDFYAAFLVRLHRKLKGEPDVHDLPPNPRKWNHPFNDLIDCWDDEERLANAILDMCDYHYRWCHEDSDEHWAEFASLFAEINPVEIHALETVRGELGLSMPKVEHELLEPPFYPLPEYARSIPSEEIIAEDDLLRRIIEANIAWIEGRED